MGNFLPYKEKIVNCKLQIHSVNLYELNQHQKNYIKYTIKSQMFYFL